MNIWDIDKLIIFLLFVIPGFVTIKTYRLISPSRVKDFQTTLFDAIGYSMLNFGVLSWLIVFINKESFYKEYPAGYHLTMLLILFVFPIFWAILFKIISSCGPVQKLIVHPIQKPWDFVFIQRKAYWVIAHLKDGRKIGGLYGVNSFTSSFPEQEQIYLEEVWKLDENGMFQGKVEKSMGIIILRDELTAVELFYS